MAEETRLSIEETNKLRLKLGLKPLNIGPTDQVSGAAPAAVISSESQERLAADNFKRKRDAEEKAKVANDAAERVRKARERAARDRKLKGKTLADDGEDEEEDTLSWIRRLKSAPTSKTAAESKEPKRTVPKHSYTSEDLKGLKVGHDLEELESGNDVMLTLKDGNVLDDDADVELVNVDLSERQALKAKLDSKKRKSVYTTYEDDEIDENTGQKKILARYDEDVDGGSKAPAGFIINSDTVQSSKEPNLSASVAKRTMISLDTPEVDMPAASDYAESIVMKKPKKKKNKPLRRPKTTTDEAEDNEGGRDEAVQVQARTQSVAVLDNLVDDEDLQTRLARQRRLALQKRKYINPEERIVSPALPDEHEMDSSAGEVLDETTEFIRSLHDIKVQPPPRPKREHSDPRLEPDMRTKDVEMRDSTADTAAAPEATIKSEPIDAPDLTTTGLEEEATLDQGLGATLKMLRQKGLFQQNEDEARRKQDQEAWLAKNRKIQLEIEMERRRVREELRSSPKYRSMSAREREAFAASENRRLDALEAKANQERFKDYKPTIELKYIDDFGRSMSSKEAFKHMSHQFHGKDSGSGKTAKKLAQIEKEKQAAQKSLF